jgi:hypothetical protein
MKIALYVHCFFPRHFYGTEAYTLALAKELAAAGHEPVVVSATLAGEPGQKNVIEDYIHEGVRLSRTTAFATATSSPPCGISMSVCFAGCGPMSFMSAI